MVTNFRFFFSEAGGTANPPKSPFDKGGLTGFRRFVALHAAQGTEPPFWRKAQKPHASQNT